MAEGGVDAQVLTKAIRKAVLDHDSGVEAGPTAIMKIVQENGGEEFKSIGVQKFKKAYAKVKTTLLEEQEQARIEALKPRVGTIENCPGRHGLKRFTTNHGSYCCDTCRCYLPIGVPMWGCRDCDWDVCEGRCHPYSLTFADFNATLANIEEKVGAIKADESVDRKTKLAMIEADIHRLEKDLDNTNVADLVKYSLVKITEDEAKSERKRLVAMIGDLLVKLDSTFKELATSDRGAEGGVDQAEQPSPEQN